MSQYPEQNPPIVLIPRGPYRPLDDTERSVQLIFKNRVAHGTTTPFQMTPNIRLKHLFRLAIDHVELPSDLLLRTTCSIPCLDDPHCSHELVVHNRLVWHGVPNAARVVATAGVGPLPALVLASPQAESILTHPCGIDRDYARLRPLLADFIVNVRNAGIVIELNSDILYYGEGRLFIMDWRTARLPLPQANPLTEGWFISIEDEVEQFIKQHKARNEREMANDPGMFFIINDGSLPGVETV